MLLVYLFAILMDRGYIFRNGSGFLMLTAISCAIYLPFRTKKKLLTNSENQRITTVNLIETRNRKSIGDTRTRWMYGLIVFIILVYLLHDFLGKASFRFFLFMDNMLRISDTFNPVFMWAVLGLFAGSVYGSFVAYKKYRLPFTVNLIPLGIFLLIIFILVLVNDPAHSSHSNNKTSQPVLTTKNDLKRNFLIFEKNFIKTLLLPLTVTCC